MVKSDKFFWGIVASMILVMLSFVIWQLAFSNTGYNTGSGPEDALSNYIAALHEGDYEIAYGYLSDSLRYYPRDADTFRRTVRDEIPDNYDFLVFKTEIVSKGKKATVEIIPFGNNWGYIRYWYFQPFVLTGEGGDWKISDIEGDRNYYLEYFNTCWIEKCD